MLCCPLVLAGPGGAAGEDGGAPARVSSLSRPAGQAGEEESVAGEPSGAGEEAGIPPHIGRPPQAGGACPRIEEPPLPGVQPGSCGPVPAEPEQEPEPPYSIEYELDPYYSNVYFLYNFADEDIPDLGSSPEYRIYSYLLANSYKPRCLVLETSVYPLPILGVGIRENEPDLYEELTVNENLNLVRAVTLGFEEPYAFSLFLGNVVRFTQPGHGVNYANKGYTGYLVSVGQYHIKDNELIEDDWVEMEAKIKGDRDFECRKLTYSFRVGAKFHGNDDIRDVGYVSFRRSDLDYEAPFCSLFKNSGFEYTFDFSIRTGRQMAHYFVADKKLPMVHAGLVLEVGFLWESEDKYTGELARDEDEQLSGGSFQFLVQPKIAF
ncbi:MAG: hypothetical protein JRI97_10155 [Deltaproteobacteria bacterium]|nr:hypothetical protein [Deltaproteobacteria bacterium]